MCLMLMCFLPPRLNSGSQGGICTRLSEKVSNTHMLVPIKSPVTPLSLALPQLFSPNFTCYCLLKPTKSAHASCMCLEVGPPTGASLKKMESPLAASGCQQCLTEGWSFISPAQGSSLSKSAYPHIPNVPKITHIEKETVVDEDVSVEFLWL